MLAGGHGAERQVARGEALGQGHEVGVGAELLKAEPGAAAPEAGDHLVVDDEDVAGLAGLADHRPVLGRRRDHAAGADHRLAEHGADVLGAVEGDLLLDDAGTLHAAVLAVGLVPGAAVAVRGAELDEPGQQGLELLPVDGEPLGARRGHRGAVVGAVAEEDHVLGAVAAVAVVLARHLDGGLDRLAAAEGEEDVVEVARQQRGDLGGELDRGLVGDPEDVVDRELLHLRLDGVVDLAAAVADVDRPQAGEGVDVLVALGVVDERALGVVHDDGPQALELGERRPEVAEEVLPEVGLAGVVDRLRHGSSRRAGRAPLPGRLTSSRARRPPRWMKLSGPGRRVKAAEQGGAVLGPPRPRQPVTSRPRPAPSGVRSSRPTASRAWRRADRRRR